MFDFDDDVMEKLHEEHFAQPVLVCWYSGGFRHSDGVALLKDFTDGLIDMIPDQLVLGFPDYYGMTDEGYDGWPKYVDKLVAEIDKHDHIRGRPLILLGHSRGACPAMSVANRLGPRVLKLYICACGPIIPGQPTGWEMMSKDFKKGGNKELLVWFSGLNPNPMLSQVARMNRDQVEEAIKQSPWLRDTTELMRVQYRDAMFPDMTSESSPCGQVRCPIMAAGLLRDPGCLPEAAKGWKFSTSNVFELVTIDAGHMDCLEFKENDRGRWKCELLDEFSKDMEQFIPGYN